MSREGRFLEKKIPIGEVVSVITRTHAENIPTEVILPICFFVIILILFISLFACVEVHAPCFRKTKPCQFAEKPTLFLMAISLRLRAHQFVPVSFFKLVHIQILCRTHFATFCYENFYSLTFDFVLEVGKSIKLTSSHCRG